MSNLLVRPYKEDDKVIADTYDLDQRGVKSKNVYVFICEEDGKAIGVAMGRANPGSDTCFLDYIRVEPTRWDAFLALMRRHAQNGIDTGHKYAEAVVPAKNPCTQLGTSTAVTAGLTTRIALTWQGMGKDTTDNSVWAQRTHPELKPLIERLDAELAKLKAEVKYA
jgi:hypothetical protein